MLEAELIEDAAHLAELAPEWHALAIAMAQPMVLPAWMLGWFRHLAPPDAALRAVAVRERGRLVGLAPMFVEPAKAGRVDYRLLGVNSSRTTPLAVPGREWEVADAIAPVLAAARPRPDIIALESSPLRTQWPRALCHAWPGKVGARAISYLIQPAPVVSLGANSFEDWLAGKSSNYRSEMRRRRRGFEKVGGSTRVTTMETLTDDIASYIRLHKGRWAGRGTSSMVGIEDRMQALLIDLGTELLGDGHFRLLLLEADGEAIAAQVHLEAGGEVLFVNSGWDERFARFSPSVLCLLAALELGFARGDRRLDLGPGNHPYKLRMADGVDPTSSTILMLPGRRLPLTYARTAPLLIRWRAVNTAKRVLSSANVDRLRGVRARLGGS